MSTQQVIDAWERGVEPYAALTKAQRAAQRAAFADKVYAASEIIRDGAYIEVRDACINESKNEVEVEP